MPYTPTFQPSSLSYGCGDYGDLALSNPRGAMAVTGKLSKDATLTLFTGGGYAVAEALKGKQAKLGEAEGNAKKWKLRYLKCKKKRKDKGKSIYPGNPGKGPFYRDCREKYKEWKHFEQKAAKLAKELQKSLSDKDKLHPQAEKELVMIQARPVKGAEKEFNEAVKDWEANQKKGGKKSSKPKKDNFLAASLDPELAAATIEGDGDDGFPLWLLGIGGLAAVGGIAYYILAE